MGQVQSQAQTPPASGFWSMFSINPGQPVVYVNRPVSPTAAVPAQNTSQKVPNVKPINTTNKNKNKNKNAVLPPVNTAVSNVQAATQNTSQNATQAASGGKRGKKKTRRVRR